MDERYWKGIREFNEKDFFQAHETLEDLWHEYRNTDRVFLQALIQLSAGLYHLDAGNWKGAHSQISRGLRKLDPYRPSHQGIDVQQLTAQAQECLNAVNQLELGSVQSFDISLFPQINILSE
jgi:uncharacterized protein